MADTSHKELDGCLKEPMILLKYTSTGCYLGSLAKSKQENCMLTKLEQAPLQLVKG